MILIVVPRLADVPENDKSPDCEKILASLSGVESIPIPEFDPPDVETTNCDVCEGRGFLHDCPSCQCECESCENGQVTESASVGIFGIPYDAECIKMLQSLPSLRLAAGPPAGPVRFDFDGGYGAIMPRRGPADNHVEALRTETLAVAP